MFCCLSARPETKNNYSVASIPFLSPLLLCPVFFRHPTFPSLNYGGPKFEGCFPSPSFSTYQFILAAVDTEGHYSAISTLPPLFFLPFVFCCCSGVAFWVFIWLRVSVALPDMHSEKNRIRKVDKKPN